jgi:general secretion pathway protein G
MKRRTTIRQRRGGFTMVELLVVILILTVLVSLTLAGVLRFLTLGPRVQARTEIGELEAAVGNFQTKFNVPYIPSRIRLCRLFSSYGATNLDADSKDYLLRVFPGLRNSWALPKNPTAVNWSRDPAWSGDEVLEGHQCLVFFLGGIQEASPDSCTGFSTNPKDPSAPGGDRIPAFYEFSSNRLARPAGKTFFQYLDPYRNKKTPQPYAFFSHYKTSNGYNRYSAANNFPAAGAPATSDCASLGVQPYFEAAGPPTRYYKPDSFQIVSAGPDGTFGPGGLYSPTNLAAVPAAAKDDQTNFVASPLGSEQ